MVNGKNPLLEAMDQVIATQDALIEETQERLIAAEVALRVQQELQARAEIPKRSRMTAAEKSRWIRANGLLSYQALPW
jgi:hypothetical protein